MRALRVEKEGEVDDIFLGRHAIGWEEVLWRGWDGAAIRSAEGHFLFLLKIWVVAGSKGLNSAKH